MRQLLNFKIEKDALVEDNALSFKVFGKSVAVTMDGVNGKMWVRILSSLVGIPVLIGVVAWGGWVLQMALLIVVLIGMREFYQALSNGKDKCIHFIGYFFASLYIIGMEQFVKQPYLFSLFISIFVVLVLINIVFFYKKVTVLEAISVIFGFFYICYLFSHIFWIRSNPYGNYFVWLVFICAWGCDSGAYFTGMLLGKHKLVPQLSPKKTVEGAIGGVITAVILGTVFGYFVKGFFQLHEINTVLLCIVTSAIGAILSQVGDLAASAIKRSVNLKDYGQLIPGHGGILDRFDSVLLTAPAVYYVIFFLIPGAY